MKQLILVFAILYLLFPVNIIAQVPQRHASAEVQQKQRDKADYREFRKQIVTLKEFADEKKKIPGLQKGGKEIVKIIATIDSTDTEDETKTLKGYITQQIGDNNINAYEISFDRATRKIATIKKTGDAAEPEPAVAKEKTGDKKKPTTAKKKKDEDGDDEEVDEPDDKPAKTSKKDDVE